jgi:uncharacterized membrane protein
MAKSISRILRSAVVIIAASGCALAQYGPGGGTGGGTSGGTYNPGSRSYGHGALIGGIVAGGAGAGVLLLALHHHRHAAMAVVGCVAPDGKTLTADKGKKTYELAGAPVTAGEHVSLVAKRTKGGSGDELEVLSVKQDLGQCHEGPVTSAER